MAKPKTPKERMPAECFPPGDFVREEMEQRGWTPEQFAAMVGWEQSLLRSVLSGTEPITEQQAKDLARGFNASHSFWLNLEAAYRRWLGRVRFDDTSRQAE